MDALIEGALQRGDGGESLLSQLSESRLSDRELHARLSSLCALLCGSESRLGLLVVPASTSAYATTQSLAMALLRRVLGTLHEPSAALLYGMNSDHLPAPTRRALRDGDLDSLPRLYKRRLVGGASDEVMSGSGIPGNVSSPRTPLPSSNVSAMMTSGKPVPPKKIMFNMLEYFLFSFAHTPLLVGEFFARAEAVAGGVPAVGPNTNGRQKSHPFYRLSTLSKEQNMVGDRTLEKTPYTETLRSFLAFFLPLVSPASAATGAEEEESLSSMQQKPITLTTKNNQDGSTLPKDIYACRHLDMVKKAEAVEFFIGALLEVWLCQNDYDAAKGRGPGAADRDLMAFWTYARPSLETLYSVGLVISHVLGMDLRGVSIEGGVHHPPAHLQQQQQITAGKKRDPSLQTLDGVYQSLKLFTYRSLRQDLYPFLRLAMENWSRDESLGDVVELWLAYITPWTVFGDAHFSDAWADYVRDNFLFYTALLSDFVQAAKKFDLYAAVRPLSRSARSSKTSCYRPTRLIDMVDAVLKVFSDERLLRHLQVMETALSSLEAYTAGAGIGLSRGGVSGNGGGGSTLGTPLRSTTPLRLHPSTLASGDRGYSNCGPLLRTQIQALEGKTGYTPVFIIGAEGSAFANDVKRIGQSLIEAARRLEYLSSQQQQAQQEGQHSSSRPSSPTHGVPQPSRAVAPSHTNWISQVFAALTGPSTPPKPAAVYSKLDLLKMTTDSERLMRMAGEIVMIWNIELDDQTEIASLDTTFPSHLSHPPSTATEVEEEEEETQFMTVAPGVWAPQVSYSSNKLTWRGKEQIKRGLRKSSKLNVPVVPSRRSVALVQTYESKTLVKLTAWLAGVLSERYSGIKASHPILPATDFSWLRLLAAPHNLLFFGLMLWIGLGLLRGVLYLILS